MNIVFFGNSKYSVIDAEVLHAHFGLITIVTIPDRQTSKQLIQSPTKKFAIGNNIPVITVDKLTSEIVEQIRNLKPDFLIVADYGLILPSKLLQVPKFAALNVHHSLLPKFRGPAPVPATLLSGDTISGVTIIVMNNKVDAGDILAQKRYDLKPDDTTDSLLTELNKLGAQAVIEVIKNYKNIKHIKQDESQATFTKYMSKQDGYIDADNPPEPEKLDRMIRAYYPWPGVWTLCKLEKSRLHGKIIKFLPLSRHCEERGTSDAAIPSSLAQITNNEIASPPIQSGIRKDATFLMQVEGKRPMSYKDFLNGYPEAKQWLERLIQKQKVQTA